MNNNLAEARKAGGGRGRDVSLQLVPPSYWIVLLATATAVILVIGWSIWGRLPVRAQGVGIIVPQGSTVTSITSRGQGTLTKLHVGVGSRVKAGDRLASVDTKILREQYEQASSVWNTLKSQLDERRTRADELLRDRVATTAAKKDALQAQASEAEQQVQALQSEYDQVLQEFSQGEVTVMRRDSLRNSLFSAQDTLRDARTQIAAADDDLVVFRSTQADQLFTLQQNLLVAHNTMEAARLALQRVAEVVAPVDGIVLELDADVGATVQTGMTIARLGSVEPGLSMLAYFDPIDGKRIASNLDALVQPGSVQPELYGRAKGTVQSVSPYPESREGLLSKLSNPDLVTQLMGQGAPIAVTISLTDDAHTPSGLAWTSSSGPDQRVTPGTIASVQVIVGERRPIELALPALEALGFHVTW